MAAAAWFVSSSTVAILAQGTEWADAVDAGHLDLCRGSIPPPWRCLSDSVLPPLGGAGRVGGRRRGPPWRAAARRAPAGCCRAPRLLFKGRLAAGGARLAVVVAGPVCGALLAWLFLALVKATTGTRGRLADAPSAVAPARVDKRAGRRGGWHWQAGGLPRVWAGWPRVGRALARAAYRGGPTACGGSTAAAHRRT